MKFLSVFLRTLLFILSLFLGIMAAANMAWGSAVLFFVVLIFVLPILKTRLEDRHGIKRANRIRNVFVIVFFAVGIIMLSGDEQESIYRSDTIKQEAYALYDAKMQGWPGTYEDIFLDTEYGRVHILGSGADTAPPLILIHAAAMSGFSWYKNVSSLLGKYRIFAVDNIGEIGKSELKDLSYYPDNGKKLADLYHEMMNQLGLDSAFVMAASNGGFIASNLAYYYPDMIKGMILLGPQGLTPLTNKSVFMMSIGSMYPFPLIRDWVVQWSIGKEPTVAESAYEWFDLVIKGTIPVLAHPRVLTHEQKQEMDLPVLLILGSEDKIVGDAEVARKAGEDYNNIQIEILKSNHLIQIEKADTVNKLVDEFLAKHYPVQNSLKQ
jgi:pimeloyl-ACP methyl ester carboxylesterase